MWLVYGFAKGSRASGRGFPSGSIVRPLMSPVAAARTPVANSFTASVAGPMVTFYLSY